MDQASFLERVRAAAHAGRAFRVHTKPILPGTGYVGGGDDLCARLVAEINEVGGEAVLVENRAAAQAALSALLARYAVRSALVWQHPVLDRFELRAILAAGSIATDDFDSLTALPPAEQRLRVLAANVGITSCAWAIAETGTLVMCHEPGRERMASLVPPLHVAIVEAAQVVPDLFDVFAAYETREQELPANLTLITGPSKTGDIELQLTTGVHGPKNWHVIAMRG